MTKPPANPLELPLHVRGEMALKASVEKVLLEHARQGLPIYASCHSLEPASQPAPREMSPNAKGRLGIGEDRLIRSRFFQRFFWPFPFLEAS